MTVEAMIRTMGDMRIEYFPLFDYFYAEWRDPIAKEQTFHASGDTLIEVVTSIYQKYTEYVADPA